MQQSSLDTDILNEYRSQILNSTKFVNFRGIPLPRDLQGIPIPLEIPMEAVNIQLQAVEKKLYFNKDEQENGDTEEAIQTFSSNQIYPVDRGTEQPRNLLLLVEEHSKVVIFGSPGSGKSTFLRFLARRKASRFDNPIPILVRLREYAVALNQDSKISLMKFALDVASETNPSIRPALESCIHSNNVIWLLDGLDESQNWESTISRQILNLPGRLIVTSRPIGYSIDELVSFPRFEIIALTDQKTARFMHNWFSFVATKRGKGVDWIAEKTNWLQEHLDRLPHVKELTSNPLLLTFLVILAGYEPQQELPKQRPELYRRFIEELLESWVFRRFQMSEDSLKIGSLIGEDAKKELLSGIYYLGWNLHLLYEGSKSDKEMTKAELCKNLEAYRASDWGADAKVNSISILEFWIKAGLLEVSYYKDKELISFRHLTFQEYAAASALAKNWNENPMKTWGFLQTRWHHPSWREPILMMSVMLSQGGFDLLANKMLQSHGRLEKILYRNLRLLGILLVERVNAGENVSNQVLNKTLRRLQNLLLKPYAFPEDITEVFERLWPTAKNILLDSLKTEYRQSFDAVICAVARMLKDEAIPIITKFRDSVYSNLDEQGAPKGNFTLMYGILSGAIHAMGETRSPMAVPYLTRWQAWDPGMQKDIIAALGRIGDATALPFLMSAARGGWRIAEPAIVALSSFEPSIILPILESASEEEFGSAPKRILEVINFKQNLSELSEIVSDWQGDSEFPSRAEDLIRKLLKTDLGFETMVGEVPFGAIAEALAQIPVSSLEPILRDYLKAENVQIFFVLELLKQIHSPESINILRELAASGDQYTQSEINRLLAELGDSMGLAAREKELDNLLSNPITFSNVERIQELKIGEDSRVTSYMLRALNDSELPASDQGYGNRSIKDKAYREVIKRGVQAAIPKIIELIRNDEVDWTPTYYGEGIVGFVNQSSAIPLTAKILDLLVSKFKIDSATLSLRNPANNLFGTVRDTLKLIIFTRSITPIRGTLKLLKNDGIDGLIFYEYAAEFETIEKIAQRLDILTLASKPMTDLLQVKDPMKERGAVSKTIRFSIIAVGAETAVNFIPSLLAIDMPPAWRTILSVLAFVAAVTAEFIIRQYDSDNVSKG